VAARARCPIVAGVSAELDRNTQFERLTTWARVGFAALCCERLLPAYAGFAQATGWGDIGVLGQALDRVWTAIISGQVISGEEARVLVERCLQQVPHLDDPFDTDLAAPAQNAAIAVLRTVECAPPRGSAAGRRYRRAVLGWLRSLRRSALGPGSGL
jgi:hypothetical protein